MTRLQLENMVHIMCIIKWEIEGNLGIHACYKTCSFWEFLRMAHMSIYIWVHVLKQTQPIAFIRWEDASCAVLGGSQNLYNHN